MKWRGRRGSANIEDRRTASRTTGRGGFGPFVFGRSRGSSTGFGGGSSRAPRGRARVGGVGLIVVVLIAMFLGVDPTLLLNGSGGLGGGGLMAPPHRSSTRRIARLASSFPSSSPTPRRSGPRSFRASSAPHTIRRCWCSSPA